ncbi:hypothetical protein [Streptomyces sp. NRRL F-5053]|uniref:hypothetical protein n=1 Tax=Streptomyces sp. NRRL F-5053 TaxID=1463854 RepID=UPI003B63DB2A
MPESSPESPLPFLRRAPRRAARERWNTWPEPKARVLAVARTLTSATRLRDVLTLLRPEDGIEISWTVNPGSVFTDGLDDYLARLGVEVLPWRTATRRRFELAVACTVNASMHGLRAPLMVLPHGAGYNRLVPETTGDAVSPAGLSARELMHRGKVVPATIGVSHEEQRDRLARTCPPAAPRALVVGDWCFDRITASRRRRDHYRACFGVEGHRRLVVVHSTWSEHSLLGRCPELPERLVTSLPVDEFAVAAVLHPNVWARHGTSEVLSRLARAVDAGLVIVPPEEGWRAAIVAADLIVGDHGSTTFYSASQGRVTLLAATGLDELDPHSPTAAFAHEAPRLDPDGDLYAQLRAGPARFDPGLHGGIADRQLGARGRAGRILQETMYSFLEHKGVRPPADGPEPRPVPPPAGLHRATPVAYDVDGGVLPDGTVEVRRRPVGDRLHHRAGGFFAVTDRDANEQRKWSALVLARTVVEGEHAAVDWVDERLAEQFANVAVAALGPNRCLLRLRTGGPLEAAARRGWGRAEPRLDPVLLGSAVHLWWEADPVADPAARLARDGLRVRTGGRVLEVAFTPPPGE